MYDDISNVDITAFDGCENLTSINISENNKIYKSIDGVLFNKNLSKIIKYPENKINDTYNIPQSVISIGDGAFSSNNNLKYIKISDNVQNIEENAFYDCTNLESISIPSKVESLKDNIFNGCINLKEIDIMGEINSIGNDVFNGCINLKSINISNTSNNVKNYIHYGESKLKSVEVNQGSRAFIENDGIIKYNSLEELMKSSLRENSGLTIESIENSTVYTKDKNNITTSASVFVDNLDTNSIVNQSLNVQKNINGWQSNVDFKNNMVTINGMIFEKNSGSNTVEVADLDDKFTFNAELKIPEEIIVNGQTYKVNSILWLSLYQHPEIESVTISKNIENLETREFQQSDSLKSIKVDIDNTEYSSKDGVLFSKDGKTLLAYPLGKTDAKYVVPSGVQTIGWESFSSNYHLKDVEILDGVTSIGSDAFSRLSSLTSVSIPDSVAYIDQYAFDKNNANTKYTVYSKNMKKMLVDNCNINSNSIKVIGQSNSSSSSKRNNTSLQENLIDNSQAVTDQTLNEQSSVKSNWMQIDGKWYFMNSNGIKETGWIADTDGNWYYLNQDGVMQTGWYLDTNGIWYYLNQNGTMKTGWHYEGGNWYNLSASGSMNTGWFKDIDGNWYS